MQTLTLIYNPEILATNNIEKYEVIENELVENCDFNELAISGSLLSLTVFKNVTFKNCTFFGSKLENCEFVGCKFLDTSFQFCNIDYCKFKVSSFEYCKWDVSPINNCSFDSCDLDSKSLWYVSKGRNNLKSCFSEKSEKKAA